ncbi:hypothetical protein TWF102_008074 [Orbilia oligospora]|uniref:Uncharacterized protein n=1 Tax=Orbilia oligospora TaxID=2813651 RepID=A0A7C8NHN8_ORBOL|nr:hypothetical protein TWF706_009811 [Orbilia oligospora]KAF3091851.1 hypothetical protein TWF103_011413 [Orbilia oligospora]KAF3110497.1 hypothetical protein TWF102_008074 [Orbilia oligospora]
MSFQTTTKPVEKVLMIRPPEHSSLAAPWARRFTSRVNQTNYVAIFESHTIDAHSILNAFTERGYIPPGCKIKRWKLSSEAFWRRPRYNLSMETQWQFRVELGTNGLEFWPLDT